MQKLRVDVVKQEELGVEAAQVTITMVAIILNMCFLFAGGSLILTLNGESGRVLEAFCHFGQSR